ncbi:hypothetical protein [Gordonia sp. WA4-43]|uniref:hypothetical protein n=1 Tax=Gordonia sp. WA4-43 TaxID=2878678 RepID=UPI001CF94028|nr:hypothetical protein [Gordonia sp. WA4-43]UCZ90812.1 hypothetical protein LEL84_03785 [Gordonia sp. WA4-43]
MNVPTKLGVFAAALLIVFAAAYAIAAGVAPDRPRPSSAESTHVGHTAQPSSSASPGADQVRGVSLAAGGFILGNVVAPHAPGMQAPLSFEILDAAGAAVTDFASEHDKQLHLIVVRADGAYFRHVHPTLSPEGRWSLPWQWATGGSYRIYADFVPAATGQPLTLTSTVEVSGDYRPAPAAAESRQSSVDGFDIELAGHLRAGAESELTVTVRRAGQPVTTLQPYLGAFGHLVALRQGDLAYLHVHPEGAAPTAGQLAGPQVRFATTAPTPGRYLLYLDFQVDGAVHTATFVLDAPTGAPAPTTNSTAPSADPHAGH